MSIGCARPPSGFHPSAQPLHPADPAGEHEQPHATHTYHEVTSPKSTTLKCTQRTTGTDIAFPARSFHASRARSRERSVTDVEHVLTRPSRPSAARRPSRPPSPPR